MESTASSPRGSRLNRGEEDSCSPWQVKLPYWLVSVSLKAAKIKNV